MKTRLIGVLLTGIGPAIFAACGGGSPTRPSEAISSSGAANGQFLVSGVVTEPVGIPVPAATLTVKAGTPDSLSTNSGSDGRYGLIVGGGTQTLVVTAVGYTTVTRDFVTNRDMTLNIELAPLQKRADIAGAWDATIEASEQCTDLPASLRSRTYRAAISQRGSAIEIEFSGARFTNRTRFDARLTGNDMTIDLGFWDGPRAGLIEHVTPTQLVSISGYASATTDGSTIRGTLDGRYIVAPTLQDMAWPAGCANPSHHVSFTRVR